VRRVLPGIDGLLADPSPIADRSIGLITNPSGVTAAGVPTWKALFDRSEVRLTRLFGPEHGVDGAAIYMEAVGHAVHPPTGLPAVSLYGNSLASLKPRREDLAGLEALVFDIADVGARYYTYVWTMTLAMEACAEAGLRLVVCDRPNPIGGAVEGAPQDPDHLSFVGLYPVPVRHGMTAGELARLVAAERGLDLDLVVSPVEGWARDVPFSETGLAWISPSPNIPSPATALVYPGMCLLEGTNVSEARGTTRPFEMFGAPWLSALEVAEALNGLGLPGVEFLPVHFRPLFDKHAGRTCAGALLRTTDPGAFRSFETGLQIVRSLCRLSPREFGWRTEPYEFDPRPAIDLLTGSGRFRRIVDGDLELEPELARHRSAAAAFLGRRAPHLLYPDRRPAVVALVGGHDSGKTTLLTALLPRLRSRGLTVGTIKHTGKDAEDDVEGKDSQRHAAAGAAVAGFVTPRRTTARRFGPERPLEELLRDSFRECDLVLIEGYKALAVPKIEVVRAGTSRPRVEGAAARVSDAPAEDSLPTFAFGDLDGITIQVLRLAGLTRDAGHVSGASASASGLPPAGSG
jgi:molybdopterin-guanine dinucleotide biosynthesis protein MobB